MIASAQTLILRNIRSKGLCPLSPFRKAYKSECGKFSGGLGPAGYDIALAENINLGSGGFALASTVELFDMPVDFLGIVHDKSSWARRGICVQNTVIEPGWRGYLTLELTNHSHQHIFIPAGTPIAQVVFHLLDQPTSLPYSGKYQDQAAGPQEAR